MYTPNMESQTDRCSDVRHLKYCDYFGPHLIENSTFIYQTVECSLDLVECINCKQLCCEYKFLNNGKLNDITYNFIEFEHLLYLRND